MVARHTLQILLDRRHEVNLFQEQEKYPLASDSENETSTAVYMIPQEKMSAFSNGWHIFLTAVLLTITLSISLLDRHLGDILSLTGSFSAVTLAFILPAACHLKLGKAKENFSYWYDLVLPCVTIFFGTLAFLVSTATSIYDVIKNFSENQNK